MVKSWMSTCWSGLPYTKLEAGDALILKLEVGKRRSLAFYGTLTSGRKCTTGNMHDLM